MPINRTQAKVPFPRVSRLLLKDAGWLDVEVGTLKFVDIIYTGDNDDYYNGSGATGMSFTTPEGQEVYALGESVISFLVLPEDQPEGGEA